MSSKLIVNTWNKIHEQNVNSLNTAISKGKDNEFSFILIRTTEDKYEVIIELGTDKYLLKYFININQNISYYKTYKIESNQNVFGGFIQRYLSELDIISTGASNVSHMFKKVQVVNKYFETRSIDLLVDFGMDYLKALLNYEEN